MKQLSEDVDIFKISKSWIQISKMSKLENLKNLVFCVFRWVWQDFFRSIFFRSKKFRRENFRPHIPIPNFLKIPKITLRKLCDEAWCPKTKYIIPKPWIYTVVNCPLFPGICSHRKNNCLYEGSIKKSI